MTIEHDISSAASRREATRSAEAAEVGRIIEDALNTTDPIALSKLKAELNSIDPSQSLEAWMVLAEFIKDAKPGDFNKASKALDTAEKSLQSKVDEMQKAVAKFTQQIDELREKRDTAKADHALATVYHKRYEALDTGVPAPGFGEYAKPELRAWAKRSKLI